MTFRLGMALLFLALAAPACAQDVDYGGLEQLFGEPVTTSATGSPQLAAQAPADMQIITADQIRRSGATTIPDVLNFIAGLDVRRYGTLNDDVAIRGFSQNSNPRLLVLVDGRQVYVDDYGYVAWATIPVQLAEIRQIEIVRGPASALFGFNATSGVVNIITYDPLYDSTNVISGGIGTDGTEEGRLVTTAQVPGKAGLRLSLGGLRTNEYSEAGIASTGDTQPRPHEGSFSLEARWKPAARTEIAAAVTDSTADNFGQSFYVPGVLIYRVRSADLGFATDTPAGLLTLRGYMNRTDFNANNFIITHYDNDNQVGVVQFSDLVKFANAHAIRAGLEFRDNRGWGNAYGGTAGYKDYAADAMWSWQITPALSLTNAGRIDHLALDIKGTRYAGNPFTLAQDNRAAITALSFNTGLVWQPTGQDTFRLLAGRSLQAPSLIDYGYQRVSRAGPFQLVMAGNPDLLPSTLTNYEFDYDRQWPALDASLSAAVYYQVDRDFLFSPIDITPVRSGAGLLAISHNFGSAAALGGEFGAQGNIAPGLRWDVSYSLFTVHQSLSYAPPLVPFDFSSATPASEVDFGLGYDWERLEADLQGQWQSRYTDYDKNTARTFVPVNISDFVTLNARIGYSVTPRLTLAVAGQELTAPQISETDGLPVERRVLFTATYGF
jgi:iron complex outermembrane receptor protein